MTVFNTPEYDGHERVCFFHDRRSGLRAIIALHRATPRAAGGIRMKAYSDEGLAIADALRLSRAMTYKMAFAGLQPGGGKTVVNASPEQKSPALLHALGRAIESLGGAYIAGSDVGTSDQDMRVIKEVTRFVRGADADHGDSSKATAYGVFQGIRAGVKEALGRDSLDQVHVAVQGVGHVGMQLCSLLHEAGAILVVADPNRESADAAAQRFNARLSAPDEILNAEVDVLAPCALGGVLNERSADLIQARVICGAANNQLAADSIAEHLHNRGILFVPDYVVNAGGVINGAAEGPKYDRTAVWAALDAIHRRCLDIFVLARERKISAMAAADSMAQVLIQGRDQ